MATFCVINANGEPLRWGNCSDKDVAIQASKAGESVIAELPPSPNHFRKGSQWVDRGPKPAMSTWDAQQEVWVDTRTLAKARADRIDAMRAARDAMLYGGFTWDGSPFDSDERTQSVISGMAFAATQPDWIDEYFRLADNTWRLLDATDMLAVWAAMKAHIRAAFGQFATREAAINAAATVAAVDAITWAAP